LISVRALAKEHARVNLFSRMCGINRTLPKILTNFVLNVWGTLRPNFDIKNKNRDKHDQTAYIASTYCAEAVETIFGNNYPSCSYHLRERTRNQLIKKIWQLSKNNTQTMKSHGRQMLPVSEVIELFVNECHTESLRLDQLYRALFEAADVNGDQELTLDEFRAMIQFVENAPPQSSSLSRPSSPKETNKKLLTSNSLAAYSITNTKEAEHQGNRHKNIPINIVQLYQFACQKSHELSDANLPPDQITPQGFAVAMQTAYRGRPVPKVLSSVPVLAEDMLRKAVRERWNVARPAAVDRAENFFETVEKNESNNHVENKKEFLIHLIHHIDELESYPKEEHLQAAWIAMDMLQNFRMKLV
jgi:hypothetical protein